MAFRRETTLVPFRGDPFGLLRRMTSELDRVFDAPFWESFRWPTREFTETPVHHWWPEIDVFEKEGRLFTKVDLPGMKKEEVKVEVTDGYVVISGERKSESEETKENFYRSEREYGSFSRTVPLPEGVTYDEVKATFTDGVLEVSVPLPKKVEMKPRKIAIEEPVKASKAA